MHITIQKGMHLIVQNFKFSDVSSEIHDEVIYFCFGAEVLNKYKFLIYFKNIFTTSFSFYLFSPFVCKQQNGYNHLEICAW